MKKDKEIEELIDSVLNSKKSRVFNTIDAKSYLERSKKNQKEIKNSTVALCGQTGAGKSTLLNKIDKKLKLNTGEVSKSLGRGKHTTRIVELININDGLIADTPGFSSLELTCKKEQIKEVFPEFKVNCKYTGCLHIKENGCEVIEKVKNNKILKSRYESYLKLIKEVD